MTITDPSERRILGSGLFALAGSLVGLAAALGAMAFGHMTSAANICGANPAHCLTCVGALACLMAALAVGGAGLSLLRPRPIGVAAA